MKYNEINLVIFGIFGVILSLEDLFNLFHSLRYYGIKYKLTQFYLKKDTKTKWKRKGNNSDILLLFYLEILTSVLFH